MNAMSLWFIAHVVHFVDVMLPVGQGEPVDGISFAVVPESQDGSLGIPVARLH
jgi:hypothetical protein